MCYVGPFAAQATIRETGNQHLTAKRIFLVAAESSGDLLGARLVRELKRMTPDLEVTGVGGEMLAAEGMRPEFHIRELNLMGLFEVLTHLPRLRRLFKQLVEAAKAAKPDAVILIDAPDFNMRFAKAVRSLGAPPRSPAWWTIY